MTSEVLRFTDVSLVRDQNVIVRELSWTVNAGDRWIVMGPNGAGKTTLITLASARTHPTEGAVSILGQDLGETDIQDLRIRVGLSSAALAEHIPPDEKVSDVVMTAAHGITGRWNENYEDIDRERTDALLAAFGMRAFADRQYWTLSEGERKRVQIARALMADPELLLLDEPAAGLDIAGREELLAALTEMAGDRRSPAIVLVTHHVEEIPPGFTHILLLREGAVVAQGPLEETLTADNLSDTYAMPVELTGDHGRWVARKAT
ncbi:MAG: ABC transporter ATP-binding protein [Demequina sp.]